MGQSLEERVTSLASHMSSIHLTRMLKIFFEPNSSYVDEKRLAFMYNYDDYWSSSMDMHDNDYPHDFQPFLTTIVIANLSNNTYLKSEPDCVRLKCYQ